MNTIVLKHIGKVDDNGIITTINGIKYQYQNFLLKMQELEDSDKNTLIYTINKNNRKDRNPIGRFISYNPITLNATFELFEDINLLNLNELYFGIIAKCYTDDDCDHAIINNINSFEIITKK